MRLLVILFISLHLTACTSMLLGTPSRSTSPIGSETRTAGELARDKGLSGAVRDAFEEDSALRSARIGVVTRKSVVTLSGTVSEFTTRDRALAVARNVIGVVRVNNQIEVSTR